MSIQELHKLFLASKGICTDTRKIESETIFFALKGANFNGNEFAVKAIEAGCNYAVIDEPQGENEKFILVDDVLETLQDLANYHRKQFDIPVLGITGSNGKTTTKELMGAVLSKKYNLLITEGNLNNHLGVPFTLLRMNSNHEIAIIEMGANKPGDIQELCEIAEPNYGIITNIGAAHIEGFGSIEGVAKTKTGMYRWINKSNGALFYNADDAMLQTYLPDVTLYSYGEKNGDVKGKLIKLDPFVNFSWSEGSYTSPTLRTNLVGRYNFMNYLTAVAIGNHFKVEEEDINSALTEYVPSNNRSQVQESDRNTLIVDCYNANATSMMAALESFNEVDHPNKLAIIGDMLELGEISLSEHQKMVDYLQQHQIKAILVGKEFGKTNYPFQWYENYEQLLQTENLEAIKSHLILLKGSRGIQLENIIPHL